MRFLPHVLAGIRRSEDRTIHLAAQRIDQQPEKKWSEPRALAQPPKVIFADEPTGALDTRTGTDTRYALLVAASEAGSAVLIVTRDRGPAGSLPRTIVIRNETIANGRAVA